MNHGKHSDQPSLPSRFQHQGSAPSHWRRDSTTIVRLHGWSGIREGRPLRSAACLIMYIAWRGFRPERLFPTSCEPSSRIRPVGSIVSVPAIDLHGKPATALSQGASHWLGKSGGTYRRKRNIIEQDHSRKSFSLCWKSTVSSTMKSICGIEEHRQPDSAPSGRGNSGASDPGLAPRRRGSAAPAPGFTLEPLPSGHMSDHTKHHNILWSDICPDRRGGTFPEQLPPPRTSLTWLTIRRTEVI